MKGRSNIPLISLDDEDIIDHRLDAFNETAIEAQQGNHLFLSLE